MALAVGAALAIGLIVLVVEGDQVAQGEAVVGDDEVDRGDRLASGRAVEVVRAADPGGELPEGGRLAAPEVPDRVAVLAVPLGPQRREVAHLVAAVAEVPRLGDEP